MSIQEGLWQAFLAFIKKQASLVIVLLAGLFFLGRREEENYRGVILENKELKVDNRALRESNDKNMTINQTSILQNQRVIIEHLDRIEFLLEHGRK